MTAKEVLSSALIRLGYTAENGNEQLTRRIMNKAVPVINDVYRDVFFITKGNQEFVPITTLDNELNLPSRALDVIVYGVCAFLAQSENDGDQQQWWLSVFNNKRASLSHAVSRKDTLPRSFDL